MGDIIGESTTRRIAWASGSLLLLGLTACSGPTITVETMESETNRTMDALVAQIDPAVIDRIEILFDGTSTCSGEDVDPDGSNIQWGSQTRVYLVEGTPQLDVLNGVVDDMIALGWTTGRDGESSNNGGRRVGVIPPVSPDDDAAERYSGSLASNKNGSAPSTILISSSSPCAEIGPA